MSEEGLEVYLPVCSMCGKALKGRDRPVVLLCYHIYCGMCVRGLETCRLDETPAATVVDYTEQVDTLIRSYRTPRFLTELKSLREAINVNHVECPRAFNCKIRAECPYSHTKVIHAKSNSQEWLCSGCNVMVENQECPFCHMEKPVKPLISDHVSADGEDYSLSPSKSLLAGWLGIIQVVICYSFIAGARLTYSLLEAKSHS